MNIIDRKAALIKHIIDINFAFLSDLLENSDEQIKNENVDEEHVKKQENQSHRCFCYLFWRTCRRSDDLYSEKHPSIFCSLIMSRLLSRKSLSSSTTEYKNQYGRLKTSWKRLPTVNSRLEYIVSARDTTPYAIVHTKMMYIAATR